MGSLPPAHQKQRALSERDFIPHEGTWRGSAGQTGRWEPSAPLPQAQGSRREQTIP